MDIAAQFNQYFMEQGHHLGAYILCITLLDILPDYRTNLNKIYAFIGKLYDFRSAIVGGGSAFYITQGFNFIDNLPHGLLADTCSFSQISHPGTLQTQMKK